MKILVSAFSNLDTDQRIEKVCETLFRNGYNIELIGNDWGGAADLKRAYPITRIHIASKNLRLAYPEFNRKLYSELKKRATPNTVLLANDLDALLPNVIFSNKLNIPLVFDSHEIFTEMPAIKGRFTQKIWKTLEKKLVPGIRYMMTESASYAEWFKNEYGVNPLVIRNIPRKISENIDISVNNPKVIIYQGAINESRGLPSAIKMMHFVDNAVLKIAGDGPKRKELEELAARENLQNKVNFVGKLLPDDLRQFTKKADVGISIEENGGVSYLYSLPNKVADYIQSRVPLVMINFPEMMRVYDEFKVGEIAENHNPKDLAEKVGIVLQNGRAFYRSELDRAASELCWEKEEAKIIDLFRKVVEENFH